MNYTSMQIQIIDLFAVMHSEVTMLSSYLSGIPWEEMELKGTSGLILSDPVRLKFNHPPPPPHHHQIAYLIQPCPSCDHISCLWLVCVVTSIVGWRIWVIPEQECCLQALLVIYLIRGEKLGIKLVSLFVIFGWSWSKPCKIVFLWLLFLLRNDSSCFVLQ